MGVSVRKWELAGLMGVSGTWWELVGVVGGPVTGCTSHLGPPYGSYGKYRR